MKKLFIILGLLLLAPITVNAASNDFTTSFDQDKCELHVTGTETGHEAQVYYYENNVFKGMGTNTINNNNFEVVFTLSYNTDTKIKIIVTDENGDNKIEKENINVPACTPPVRAKKTELFDNQGNSIIINNSNVGFEDDDYFEVEIQSKSQIDQIIEAAQGTPNYDSMKAMLEKMNSAIGDGNELKYYISSVVRDYTNNIIDYSNYNDGFVLNLLYPKDEYNKLKGLKLLSLDMNTLDKVRDINFTYDETNEMFIIDIDEPGIIIAYLDKSIANTSNNPNTGDKINRYIILLIISTVGLITTGIYTKKKIFN